MDSIRQRLENCFTAVFPALEKAHIDRADMASVEGWDSVATVTLMAVIQEEFGMEFSADELGLLISFDSILNVLKNRGFEV